MSGSAVQFSKAGVLMEPGPYHVHMSFQRRVTATFDRIQSTREWLLSSHRTKCIAGLVVAALVLIVLCVSLADWASSASSTSPSSTTLSQLVTTDATTTTTETSATTTTALVCGHDWVFYGEKCYQVLGRQTFAEAERDCETLSGTLASIHDLQQNLFLTKYVRTKYGEEVKFYIGLQRNWTGHFEWFDGSAYDFQAWQPNEPNAPHTEACVEVWTTYGQTTNGRWNDIGCDAHRYALCQKNLGSAQSGCSKAEWGDARTASDGPLVCARIYPNKYCTGYPLLLSIESHIPDLKSTSAAVSSRDALALVRPGCKLELWSGRDYTGRHEESFKTHPWKVNMRGKLSASCTCSTNNTEILTCKPKEVWSLVKRCDFTEYDYGGKCAYPTKFGYDLSSLYGQFEDYDKQAMTSVVEEFVGSNGEEIYAQENAETASQFISMDVPSGGEVSIFRKAYYCGEYRLATPEIKVKSGKSSQSGTVGSSTGPTQASQCSSYVPKSLYSGQGTVTSPNYPKSYAPNAFVNYPLVAASSNGTIKLRITDFKTEDGHDKLYIQNGLNDPHMETLSGVHNDTLVYRSTGPIMLLTFVTDNNVEMQGWYATFTTEYA